MTYTNNGTNGRSSSYRSFAEIGDDNHMYIQVSPEEREAPRPWAPYLNDLDDFFRRLYKYHQVSGFSCSVCGQLLELCQIVYSVFLPIFFLNYIDYNILFKNQSPDPKNSNAKVHIYDVIKSYDSITLPFYQRVAIFLACLFLLWKTWKTMHSMMVNLAIRQFYRDVLHINDCSSLTWQDVQARIISSRQAYLSQDNHITELDVHNRILRHTNYMIALINRGVLPIYYQAPIIGSTVFFTQSFLYNCELLFWRGPLKCVFDRNWLIASDVKNQSQRQLVAKKLERRIWILAMINLILCPILLVWQVLYFFYSNAALVKRDPVILGLRNWSLYARWFCRHFNELDHQLNDRLNHAYKPAKNYMDAFTSPFLEIIARHVRFVSGSTFAVLLLLTIYDEDVIQVVHLLTIITVLWVIWSSASGFILPDIPMRFTKTELYDQILQHIHYVPHNYPPFTPQARSSMADLFQYKIVKLLEDLFSTLATPYIMVRHLRSRSLEIVDFFRNYTVEILGTGDVCVFSLMNIKENGNPVWQPFPNAPDKLISDMNRSQKSTIDDKENSQRQDYMPIERLVGNETNLLSDQDMQTVELAPHNIPTSSYNQQETSAIAQASTSGTVHQFEKETMRTHALPMQTEHGKLELSLINFKLQNPSWNPSSENQKEFIEQVTSQAIEQASSRQLSNILVSQHDDRDHQQSPYTSGLFQRPRSPHNIHDIDSSTAVGLSTMFLHEHARLPMSTNFATTSSYQQPPPLPPPLLSSVQSTRSQLSQQRQRQPKTERDPLL